MRARGCATGRSSGAGVADALRVPPQQPHYGARSLLPRTSTPSRACSPLTPTFFRADHLDSHSSCSQGSTLKIVENAGHALPSQIRDEYHAWIREVVESESESE